MMGVLHEESVSTAVPATGPFVTVIGKSIDVAVQEAAFAHVFVIEMVGGGGVLQVALRTDVASGLTVTPLIVAVALDTTVSVEFAPGVPVYEPVQVVDAPTANVVAPQLKTALSSVTETLFKASEPQFDTATETPIIPVQVVALVQLFTTWRQGATSVTSEVPVSGTVWRPCVAPQKVGWSVCSPEAKLASCAGRLTTVAVKCTSQPALSVPGEDNIIGFPSVNVTAPLASGIDIVKVLPEQALQNPVPSPVQQLNGLLKLKQSALLPPTPVALSEKTVSLLPQGKDVVPHCGV